MLKIHCAVNYKSDLNLSEGRKAFKVEYIQNGGYWAKWYTAYSRSEAKEKFKAEYPALEYCRCKTY